MASPVVTLSAPAASVAPKSSSSRDAGQGDDFGSTLAREVAARQPVPAGKDAASADQSRKDDAPEPGDAATPWLALLQSMAQVVAQPLPQEEAVSSEHLPDGGVDALAAAVTPAMISQAVQSPVQGEQPTTPALSTVASTAGSDSAASAIDELAVGGKALPAGFAAGDAETAEPRGIDLLSAAPLGASPLRSVDEAAAPTKPVATHNVVPHVGEPRWGDAVAQRVAMMIGKQEQKLEMQLNPPNLGPMDVQLTLAQDQASIVFASQHAAVREALAAATPRLTALLADQGIQLVNVQVASDTLNQHTQQQAQTGHDSGPAQRGMASQSTDQPTDLRVDLGTLRLPVGGGGLSFYA
ncbi:hypothetical protein JHS3_01970 [Jeongeupia sp. HS-3]|uniref:flagellar hook-length control protein FliK n=1 Tax=Jeongeupia sp. HS-3 TaxID=1009682 RepID=UPI0018A4E152|nr:flagellar hook-length control protein FliK [Jeongeupia sp. HS-3]BCL74461.1 hypothetical protein JHS3_01970 [Jeongeupia sp. HS-3]